MGSGSFSSASYAYYNTSRGKSMDLDTGRITDGQEFTARRIDADLDPRKFKMRECANSEEHPNTIPVILALDVTGSMGRACMETAQALGVIITNLYKKYKDIEFCVMGIGDLAYDTSPIQMSQFESDVRIAEALDKIYMEHGGGGNRYESYTAAWYMGLHRTKLDCFDKQGRKGIIITMGDETLNPYLPFARLNSAIDDTCQANVETKQLFEDASKKFDIFHIGINETGTYKYLENEIKESFTAVLGQRFKISNINQLAQTIEDCITESIEGTGAEETSQAQVNENGEISW
jgi:hypothetical protein